jgi:AcrR family transcriptional regulator
VSRPGDTRPRRPTRRAGRRKDEVLAAACRVIAERGADATRFADVAQSSGVPISTLQYYFGSREDLLVAAFQHASRAELAELREALPALDDPWRRLALLVRTALAGYAPDSSGSGRLWIEAWRFGMRDPDMRTDVHRDYAAWRALLAEVITAGADAGRFAPSRSPAETAVVALALLDGLGVPLAVADPAVPPENAAEIALAALAELLRIHPRPADRIAP